MQSTVGVDNIVLHINLANVDCILAKLTITCLILINAHFTKGILRIVGLASSGGINWLENHVIPSKNMYYYVVTNVSWMFFAEGYYSYTVATLYLARLSRYTNLQNLLSRYTKPYTLNSSTDVTISAKTRLVRTSMHIEKIKIIK